MIKAILFDVDGVLVHTLKADVAMYQEMFTKAGYAAPDETEVADLIHLPVWEGVKRLLKTNDMQEINRVRDVLLKPGELHESFIKPQDNLEETLTLLSGHYRLGVVTGRFKQGFNELFAGQKIISLFEQIVTYEDTELHKPDPEPLLLALNRMNLLPEEAVYVGDMDYDVLAARKAGMLSIHLSGKSVPDATISIREFAELIPAVHRLSDTAIAS